jgi:hypothetical protein
MPAPSKVQLVISGFGDDASMVSRLLGFEPTTVGVPGWNSREPSTHRASWIYEISMTGTESVEGQALALLRFLECHAEKIRKTATLFPARVLIGVDDQNSPGTGQLALVPLVVAEISKLGLGIQVQFSPL